MGCDDSSFYPDEDRAAFPADKYIATLGAGIMFLR